MCTNIIPHNFLERGALTEIPSPTVSVRACESVLPIVFVIEADDVICEGIVKGTYNTQKYIGKIHRFTHTYLFNRFVIK